MWGGGGAVRELDGVEGGAVRELDGVGVELTMMVMWYPAAIVVSNESASVRIPPLAW